MRSLGNQNEVIEQTQLGPWADKIRSLGRQNEVLGTFAVALTVWDYSHLGL